MTTGSVLPAESLGVDVASSDKGSMRPDLLSFGLLPTTKAPFAYGPVKTSGDNPWLDSSLSSFVLTRPHPKSDCRYIVPMRVDLSENFRFRYGRKVV